MKSKFQKVSDVLSTLMKGYGLSSKINEYKILKIWDEAVGDKITSHTHPLRLIRGILTVVVDSPTWMQQLTFYKEDLIEKINNGIGKDTVKDIRFKTGKVETKPKTSNSKLRSPQKQGPNSKLSSLQSKTIEGYLEPVKDSEIREVIKRTIAKALIRGKGKD